VRSVVSLIFITLQLISLNANLSAFKHIVKKYKSVGITL